MKAADHGRVKHVNVALFVAHEGCPRQCSFCNQRSISGEPERLTPQKIEESCKTALNSLSSKEIEAGEIAFFGGSFTAIEKAYMTELLCCASAFIGKGLFKGIRISTRPDAIDDATLSLLKNHGVSSIELGAQSMDSAVLSFNNRGHSPEAVSSASALIKSFGFELGLQMMTGLYMSENRDCIETAEKMIALSPETVRIYPTIVLKGTPLAALFKEGRYSPQTLEEAVSLSAKLIEMFQGAGIRVIRVGLHSGGGVPEGYVAGPYHPAFRELCEGEIYLKRAKLALEKSRIEPGNASLFVNPSEISKMTGQNRRNLVSLNSQGYMCKIFPDSSLLPYQVLAKSIKK